MGHKYNYGHLTGSIPRTSCDSGSNRFGDCLLELCKAVDLQIVNERTENTSYKAKFTCFTHNGESLVDYLLTQFENFDTIKDLNVHDFTVYSNYAPLTFNIVVNNQQTDSVENDAQKVYRWNSSYKEQLNYDIASSIEYLNKDIEDGI